MSALKAAAAWPFPSATDSLAAQLRKHCGDLIHVSGKEATIQWAVRADELMGRAAARLDDQERQIKDLEGLRG